MGRTISVGTNASGQRGIYSSGGGITGFSSHGAGGGGGMTGGIYNSGGSMYGASTHGANNAATQFRQVLLLLLLLRLLLVSLTHPYG